MRLVLLMVLVAGFSGMLGEFIGRDGAHKAQVQAKEALDLADRAVATATSANATVAECYETYNQTAEVVNAFIDVLWDLPLERVAKIVNGMPKPEHMPMMEVPNATK